MIKRKKKSHFENLVKNCLSQNIKPLWEASNMKSKNPQSVCSSDITADVMNQFFFYCSFKTMFQICHKWVSFPGELNQYATKGKLHVLSFENFTPASSCFYSKEISSNKSTGPDGVCCPTAEENAALYIVNILTDMFHRILSEGCFPSD